MHKRLMTGAVGVLSLLLPTSLRAQDGEECFSKLTRYNICEKAREAQKGFASSLPQKLSANLTLSAATVVGPRIILTAIWHTTKSALDETLKASGTTLADLDARMFQATRNTVCGLPTMPAFIRLGGQVQYVYKTDDGVPVLMPVITAC